MLPLSELFQTGLVMNLQASPISKVYRTCAFGINKFGVSRVCQVSLVKNSQAFTFQECFKFTLVVNTQAFPSRVCLKCDRGG